MFVKHPGGTERVSVDRIEHVGPGGIFDVPDHVAKTLLGLGIGFIPYTQPIKAEPQNPKELSSPPSVNPGDQDFPEDLGNEKEQDQKKINKK